MNNRLLKIIALLLFSFTFALVVGAAGRNNPFVLVIDAGHGGKDAGAIGRYSKEKNINLKVALAFGKLVERNCSDVKVVYTRKTDVFVPLQGRADIANNVKADLFISVHTNSLPKGRIAYGTETYTLGIARADENLEVAKRENSVIMLENNYKQVYQGFDPNKVESYIIFELMQDQNMEQSVEMARCLQQQYVSHAGRRDKGVHQAGFLVLRNTSMPAILTELGFISTPAEENFLNSEAGVNKMARSLYNGFLNYRSKYKLSDGLEPVVEAPVARPSQPIDKKVSPQKNPSKSVSSSSSKVEDQNGQPVFKVQLMASEKLLNLNDRRFNGVQPVEYYKEKGLYKYTYGSTTNYNTICNMHRKVAGKLKGTFIVAFLNGERMDLSDAIKLSKRK